ncbi:MULTISPECIES: hypothetical protein [Streptomyces]|uniref:hypothetical protein n=1 Tax=Streptomyces TaxID=1883 RepID=UPI0023DBCF11|nr:hypothetical protein [Streptomyces coacervatus]MDF2264318.1 hypothetical protein [Streptomyces coacervatus]
MTTSFLGADLDVVTEHRAESPVGAQEECEEGRHDRCGDGRSEEGADHSAPIPRARIGTRL